MLLFCYIQPLDALPCPGIGVVSTGHCHPKVVKAIQDQAAQLIHSQQNIFTSSVAQVRAFACHTTCQHDTALPCRFPQQHRTHACPHDHGNCGGNPSTASCQMQPGTAMAALALHRHDGMTMQPWLYQTQSSILAAETCRHLTDAWRRVLCVRGSLDVQVGLLERMLKILPPSLTRLFFANSGSEAVDNAIKVARAHTKRQNIICFEVSLHSSRIASLPA